MNRLLFLLSVIALSAISFAGNRTSTADVAGTYVLTLGEEAAALCRLLQAPLPEAKVVLGRDATYRFEESVQGRVLTREGTFQVRSNSLVLNGKSPMKGSVKQDAIVLNGLLYQRTHVPSDEVCGDWIIVNNRGTTDGSIRMSFREDGTFRFKGMGGTSSGRYEVRGNYVHLDYMEVDGARAEFPMRGLH